MNYRFFALISRMKNITRWALMRNSFPENVQEHSHMVAVIAHGLAVIRREVFGIPCDPDRAAAAALFHDASEIYTGDMPTPVKYFNPEIMAAYKQVEALASDKLIHTLPEAMKPAYRELLAGPDEETVRLVKAADKLSAYIKCLEELKSGSSEFSLAAEQTRAKLEAMRMPEVDYFMQQFIPAFDLTLDELNEHQDS
ncbi:MAG: 5'-deoxynucleotidase [Oscillospiraceae bacterium]|nr:5'-deoxynucleotidase [Oscillospiraceae bacterium]